MSGDIYEIKYKKYKDKYIKLKYNNRGGALPSHKPKIIKQLHDALSKDFYDEIMTDNSYFIGKYTDNKPKIGEKDKFNNYYTKLNLLIYEGTEKVKKDVYVRLIIDDIIICNEIFSGELNKEGKIIKINKKSYNITSFYDKYLETNINEEDINFKDKYVVYLQKDNFKLLQIKGTEQIKEIKGIGDIFLVEENRYFGKYAIEAITYQQIFKDIKQYYNITEDNYLYLYLLKDISNEQYKNKIDEVQLDVIDISGNKINKTVKILYYIEKGTNIYFIFYDHSNIKINNNLFNYRKYEPDINKYASKYKLLLEYTQKYTHMYYDYNIDNLLIYKQDDYRYKKFNEIKMYNLLHKIDNIKQYDENNQLLIEKHTHKNLIIIPRRVSISNAISYLDYKYNKYIYCDECYTSEGLVLKDKYFMNTNHIFIGKIKDKENLKISDNMVFIKFNEISNDNIKKSQVTIQTYLNEKDIEVNKIIGEKKEEIMEYQNKIPKKEEDEDENSFDIGKQFKKENINYSFYNVIFSVDNENKIDVNKDTPVELFVWDYGYAVKKKVKVITKLNENVFLCHLIQ